MKTHQVPFEDMPFDATKAYGLSEDAISEAFSMACKAVEHTAEVADRISARAAKFLGWVVAALLSLTVALAAMLFSPSGWNIPLIILSAYGFALMLATAAILARGALYKIASFGGWASPSDFLYETTIEQLGKVAEKDQACMLRLWYLETLQEKYIYNRQEINRRVKSYRAAVVVLGTGLLIGMLGTVALIIFA